MKKKIVFFGTPDFAAYILQGLIDRSYNIVAVVSAEDKPAGRGRKIQSSAVAEVAKANSIELLQPSRLKDEDFLSKMSEINADLFIVIAFRMMPKVLWSMPSMGTFNLHASLLPQYRGAAPINWAIINGEKESGISTFFINEKIDEGGILFQQKIAIDPQDNAGMLHDKLMMSGVDLVAKTIDSIFSKTVNVIQQRDSENLNFAPKIFKEDCKIDWSKGSIEIVNLIRGLSPYPASWSVLHNNDISIEIKIYSARAVDKLHNYKCGKVVLDEKKLLIAVNSGFIEILELQISGKKRLKTTELLNGFKFSEEAYLS